MKTKLHLLFGGKSAEHKVSMQTAKAVMNAVDQSIYEVHPIYIDQEGSWNKGPVLEGKVDDVHALAFQGEKNTVSPLAISERAVKGKELDSAQVNEVVFPLLHGPNGEDGTVQGLLEILGLPYVGNGVLASSAGMDKIAMKAIFEQAGLTQVKYVGFIRKDWEEQAERVMSKIETDIGYPCFVKPANLGSSVGISKCKNQEQLKEAVKEALRYDRKIIVEEGVNAREIEIGVIGNDELECSVVGEIVPKTEFYDYQSKYEDEDTGLIIPCELPNEIYEQIKDIAKRAYKSLDCSGLARMDFFLTKDNEILINEVNTMPGFTPYSMFPLLWKHSGLEYPALINKLVELAIEKHQEKLKISYTMD
ncbi:D-alanine--D-alanine ligase [Gracilibacillus dipsosauri]|uniref:D-alanine--D-alanine ligase n=1 Tax=Gracilibacillus dipsosauri TaxID=178340 RepID=A0A317KVK6_9BACI|nr:D-alanine--D-alanine ligase [Gracilibacillus dipsosauri]PWU67541.1 D-alanine--D-alanine ligase [Gracilibacillus dipsosauri]